MKNIENIGERIKFLREKHGLSQAAFAKRIGVSAGNVGDWESEKKKSLPGAKAIYAIAKEFEVTADWLLDGEEYIVDSTFNSGNIVIQDGKPAISPSKNTGSTNDTDSNEIVNLTAEAKELITIFNSLNKRDAAELLMIARMKKELGNR
ncbi:helix-turn-helix domain-containing protein [Robertmurraya sp. FSL W8-0741]|uniref:helix-turn-helix domain-containing protein n=1 Tax=Robertmurraya TaxID=2837507 RepID=UPI0010F9FCE2|nr:helix-turn-helix domain-containing protein [Robertmurraya siralis]